MQSQSRSEILTLETCLAFVHSPCKQEIAKRITAGTNSLPAKSPPCTNPFVCRPIMIVPSRGISHHSSPLSKYFVQSNAETRHSGKFLASMNRSYASQIPSVGIQNHHTLFVPPCECNLPLVFSHGKRSDITYLCQDFSYAIQAKISARSKNMAMIAHVSAPVKSRSSAHLPSHRLPFRHSSPIDASAVNVFSSSHEIKSPSARCVQIKPIHQIGRFAPNAHALKPVPPSCRSKRRLIITSRLRIAPHCILSHFSSHIC